MHEATLVVAGESIPRAERYAAILRAVEHLLPSGTDRIAAMANVASLLYHSMPNLNWCGFYRTIGDRLVVGPFHGKPACIEIPIGRGVCGRAAMLRRAIVVEDVTTFPDHIACDPQSRSEIVVPLVEGDAVIGVLDLDSPIAGRFDDEDVEFLGRIAATIVERTGS
jgi:GAF domain-containing protein